MQRVASGGSIGIVILITIHTINWPSTKSINGIGSMDVTEHREQIEARLYVLYERYVADLETELCRVDPSYSSPDRLKVGSRRFGREEFHAYLNDSSKSAKIRRAFVRRILRFAAPEERGDIEVPALILFDKTNEVESPASDQSAKSSHSGLHSPHFLANKESPSRDNSA